jgi:hypothetical protein
VRAHINGTVYEHVVQTVHDFYRNSQEDPLFNVTGIWFVRWFIFVRCTLVKFTIEGI